MNLKHLQALIDVVEQRSFSRAAAVLNTDQALLSRQVRKLEDQIGARLLHRNGRGVELTEEGLELLNAVRPLIGGIREATERIQARREQPRGRLSFGIAHHLGEALCPTLLASFRDRFPKVRVHISGAHSGVMQEWLLQGRIDLGVSYDLGGSPQLISENLVAERIFFVGSWDLAKTHNLTNVKSISLERATHLPLVIPSEHHGLRTLLDRAATTACVSLQSSYEVDVYSTLKASVFAGLGFTMLPFGALLSEIGKRPMYAAELIEPEIVSTFSMAFACNKPTSSLTREFAKHIRAAVKDFTEEQKKSLGAFA